MVLLKYRPNTPTQRHTVLLSKKHLSKEKSIKRLTFGLSKTGGRNNTGRITSFRIGGGNKRLYHKIDLRRDIRNIPAIVLRLEYDAYRSSYIALIAYKNGLLSYILAPQNLSVGDIVISGDRIEHKAGNTSILKNILVGTDLHNVELKPGKGGQLSRAAGTSVKLVSKNNKGYVLLRLSSGEMRLVSEFCKATIGTVSNGEHKNQQFGKAGRSRWKNIRPTVRGIAMNPVDHPHGGRTNGGRPSVTPWARPTKGYRTRSPKKMNKLIISRRFK